MKEENRKFCPECGRELKESDKYCISCGYSFKQREKKKRKNIKVANLIALIVIIVITWILLRMITKQPIIPEFLTKLLKR